MAGILFVVPTSLGESPIAAHLLERIAKRHNTASGQPPHERGARGAAGRGEERLLLQDLEELIEKGRDLVDNLGPEAFEAVSLAVSRGGSPVARLTQAHSLRRLGSWSVGPGGPGGGGDGEVPQGDS